MPEECAVETGECLAWVHKYLRDCICGFRDEVSLVLGLLSVFSWGVAEVPQIITNFKEKSTEGVSLAFLMTWVVGDVFNLAGCWLEPATLPTQFYMALLYTATTLILVFQTVFYDYLVPYLHPPEPSIDGSVEDKGEAASKLADAEKPSAQDLSSSVISVPHSRRSSRDVFYTSARSLASSHTPTVGSYLVGSRESGGQAHSILRSQGSESVSAAAQEYLIPNHGNTSRHGGDSAASSNSTGGGGGSILSRTAHAAAGSVLLVGTVGLGCNFLPTGSFDGGVGGSFGGRAGGSVLGRAGGSVGGRAGGRALLLAGRRFLSYSSGGSRGAQFVPSYFREEQVGPWGEVFGWCMAAIYMGGRVPQIMLNMKRGTVEGLNPLMFIFALVGNLTYVSSILVRTLEWGQIKPNMPWLVDAGVCVMLDMFIICQFVYYASRARKAENLQEQEDEDKKGNYNLVQ